MRLLLPNDFGRFAMLLVAFNFFQILRNSGFVQAIIQSDKISKQQLSSAFWHHLAVSILMGFALYHSGEILEWLYQANNLSNLTPWFTMEFIIGSIGLVPSAILQKELAFKKIFIINVLALTISSIVGLGMAYAGMGITSLVVKLLLWTSINSLGYFITSKNKPNFSFSKRAYKKLINFGIPVTGNHLLSFSTRNLDDVLIGVFLGSKNLGFYNRAYAIMLLPLGNITGVLQTVFNPVWSKIKHEKQIVKRQYLKLSKLIATITFPAMSILAILSFPIVKITLGEQWTSMSRTLSILCFVGMLQSVGALQGVLFMVYDKNKQLLNINLATSIFTIILLLTSLYLFGTIESAAGAYAISTVLLIFPTFHYAGKIIDTDLIAMVRPMFKPFFHSLVVSSIAFLSFQYIPIDSDFIKLIISILLSFFFYLVLLNKYQKATLTDFSKMISSFQSKNNEKS